MKDINSSEIPIFARAQFYNRMPLVEAADAEVKERGKVKLAREVLAPLFIEHGVIDICGINLLHQHWRLEDNEIAEQVRLQEGDEVWLETRPVTELEQASTPASWAIYDDKDRDGFVPFEFSTDETARRCAQQLQRKPEFLNAAKVAMRANGLDRYFGLCVPLRDSLRYDGNYRQLEYSSSTQRKSTIKPVDPDEELEGGVIPTVWMFQQSAARRETMMKSAVDCVDHKSMTECVPLNECTTVIVGCVKEADGKHGTKLTHNREAGGHENVDPN
jgi:hypothetical protein